MVAVGEFETLTRDVMALNGEAWTTIREPHL